MKTNAQLPDALSDLAEIRSELVRARFTASALEIAEETAIREAERAAGSPIPRRRDARLSVILADDAALGLELETSE